ncbi:hypothetical protein J5N97_016134 [Dioscorea zingiberensis]|uniref:DEAD/DEAH-box helicase domain-containing protein n=1 Tax=Dioscorea zingiberensis TaxID=325984 RepID=A0A9D5CJT0_9LILI|nr:hypothetical protein J5N97_016134 [Dioscorea zingiberensis]
MTTIRPPSASPTSAFASGPPPPAGSSGMRRPTDVQRCCIPRILSGSNVTAVAHTGSGKTAAFALPILHRLAECPFGFLVLDEADRVLDAGFRRNSKSFINVLPRNRQTLPIFRDSDR